MIGVYLQLKTNRKSHIGGAVYWRWNSSCLPIAD